MVIIESFEGIKKEIKCISCELNKGDIMVEGVHSTIHFRVGQDYEIPIVGFFVVSSKRHIIGLADLTQDERMDFIELICKLRQAMEDVLNIKYITLLHREDTIISKTNPSHFHIALLPKYNWMESKDIFKIFDYAKTNLKTKDNLTKIKKAAAEVKQYLSSS